MALAIISIIKEVTARLNYRTDVAVPLRTGVILEREPTELYFLFAFGLVVIIRCT